MKPILFFLFLLFSLRLYAQPAAEPAGETPHDIYAQTHDGLSLQQEAAVIKMLKKNVAMLRRKGLLPRTNRTAATLFQWPLAQAPNFNDNGVYYIGNYVDEDATAGVLDYTCSNRSYDGHQGTDIALWPFPWQKMALNAVQIIAAAPGTIIAKSDGLIDTSCGGCGACNWNAVYIMQADGSVSWYGHMKKNSLTPKTIGQTVALGEFLGYVGSSGASTSPHLHFQVWANNTYSTLIDPWAGACNTLGGITWWANQQPYHVSTLNKIMTHYPLPVFSACKSGEAVNEKVNFVNGETVYLASYYRDRDAGQQQVNTIYRPDSTVFFTWNYNFASWASVDYKFFTRVLPNPAPTGLWRYVAVYNGQPPMTIYFGVNELAYVFTGNGNWEAATNWSNNTLPPTVLPVGSEILIDPIPGGECILNHIETISAGAKMTVNPGKSFRIVGDLKLL